jgi:Rod binding domain-containing protein
MRVDGVAPGPAPAGEPSEAGRLRKVAQDFEAMVLSQMLATMRQAAGKGVPSGTGQRLYREMLDDELGRVLARGGGLGLADVLVRDLVRQTATLKKASSHGPEGTMSRADGGVSPDRREGDFQ